LRPYVSIFRMWFAVRLQYRAAAFAALFTNYFFGLVRVMVYLAFYASSNIPQPLTLAQAVSYTWLTQVTFRMMPWVYEVELISQVRSGNIAYELCRPLNLYFAWYSRLVSQRLVPTLLTGIPVFIFAAVLPGSFRLGLPASPAAAIACLVSLCLALFLGCAITNIGVISTLWTIAGDGMTRVVPGVVMILSGVLIPLAYFPDWAQTALKILPFSGLVDTPFNFYLGIIPATGLMTYGLLQIFWIVFFIFIGMQVFNVAARKLVVQGG
jgi:ABC-2 type transport system permease protein